MVLLPDIDTIIARGPLNGRRKLAQEGVRRGPLNGRRKLAQVRVDAKGYRVDAKGYSVDAKGYIVDALTTTITPDRHVFDRRVSPYTKAFG
eukprot:251731-Prorocentrum_minimum.AAC.1